jgi:hypothetical protein
MLAGSNFFQMVVSVHIMIEMVKIITGFACLYILTGICLALYVRLFLTPSRSFIKDVIFLPLEMVFPDKVN